MLGEENWASTTDKKNGPFFVQIFVRRSISVILAMPAAYGLSFAVDLLLASVRGTLPRMGYFSAFLWFCTSSALLYFAIKVLPNRWLAVPYLFIGVLAAFGGIVGHWYNFIVAGIVLLQGYLLWFRAKEFGV